MLNKRGQGLSTKAIVLIVLGVTLLVFLVFGFTVGWGKFIPFLGGSDNVGTIATSCKVACSISDEDSFCSKERELRANDLTLTGSCLDFSTNPSYSEYGIDKCPGLCGSSSFSFGSSDSSTSKVEISKGRIDFSQKGTWELSQKGRYEITAHFRNKEDAKEACHEFSTYCLQRGYTCPLKNIFVKYEKSGGIFVTDPCDEV